MKKLIMLMLCVTSFLYLKSAPEIVPVDGPEKVELKAPDINQPVLRSADQVAPPLDVSDPNSLIGYWEFLYVLLMPIGNYILARFWPSNTKQSLTLKTSVFAITVLVAFLSVKGWSMAVIIKAFTLFIGQALLYDKVMNPMGMKSKLKELKE